MQPQAVCSACPVRSTPEQGFTSRHNQRVACSPAFGVSVKEYLVIAGLKKRLLIGISNGTAPVGAPWKRDVCDGCACSPWSLDVLPCGHVGHVRPVRCFVNLFQSMLYLIIVTRIQMENFDFNQR